MISYFKFCPIFSIVSFSKKGLNFSKTKAPDHHFQELEHNTLFLLHMKKRSQPIWLQAYLDLLFLCQNRLISDALIFLTRRLEPNLCLRIGKNDLCFQRFVGAKIFLSVHIMGNRKNIQLLTGIRFSLGVLCLLSAFDGIVFCILIKNTIKGLHGSSEFKILKYLSNLFIIRCVQFEIFFMESHRTIQHNGGQFFR